MQPTKTTILENNRFLLTVFFQQNGNNFFRIYEVGRQHILLILPTKQPTARMEPRQGPGVFITQAATYKMDVSWITTRCCAKTATHACCAPRSLTCFTVHPMYMHMGLSAWAALLYKILPRRNRVKYFTQSADCEGQWQRRGVSQHCHAAERIQTQH